LGETRGYEQAIAAGIARAREANGWSQHDLASVMRHSMGFAWTRTAVSNIESGQRLPSIKELPTLLYVLGVSIGELIGPESVRMPWGTVTVRDKGGEFAQAIFTGEERRHEAEGGVPGPTGADIESEAHAAARLGVTVPDLQLACFREFGRGFLQERDRRVAQKIAARGGGEVPRRTLQALRAAAAKQIVTDLERREAPAKP